MRKQLTKNHVCALLFSSGPPMILGGDELARTQRGNNNAYCQDNDISWLDWSSPSRHGELFEFFRKAIAFTRRFPILQRRKFYVGQDLDDDGVPDLDWFAPEGGEPRWHDPEARTLCCQLDTIEEGHATAQSPDAERLFFVANAHFEPRRVALPALGPDRAWYRAVDTSLPDGEDFAEPGKEIRIDPGDHYLANARSTVVLLAR